MSNFEKSEFVNSEKALKVALAACRRGREVLQSYFGHLQHIEEKRNAGLVSEADQLSEKVITEHLLRFYPRSEVLGEESAFAGHQVQGQKGGAEGRWILDPLDGTTNYIHNFPVYCISLALEVDGVLRLGIVDVPHFNETYVGIRGKGAFVNGRRIQVSKTTTLKDSLLATGFFPDDEVALEEQLQIFSKLVRQCRGVRRAGAAAYDLCQVARGVFDGFWEKNLKPWDVAAGQIIVEEAGGTVVTYSGEVHDPYQSSILATTPGLVQSVLQKIRDSHAS